MSKAIADLLRYQIDYTIWATSRLLNAATALSEEERQRDFGTADKSVEGTLIHIFRSERTWLARLVAPSDVPPFKEPEDSWNIIVEQWPGLHNRWSAWAGVMTDDVANAVHRYRDLQGVERANAIWAIVLHVVNHSTHHRGQVSGFLRALGNVPPSLDSIGYARSLGI